MAVSPNLARLKKLMTEIATSVQMNQATLQGLKNQVVAVSADTTLTADQSGATIFWDASTSNTLTLPAAAAGLNYKVILKDTVNTDDGARIAVTVGDCFYGLVSVTSTTDHKMSSQAVDYDTAIATETSYDNLNFSPDANTTGGTSGDVIEITAVNDNAWHIRCILTTTGTAPASVATIGAS